jgi:hypothetical protein
VTPEENPATARCDHVHVRYDPLNGDTRMTTCVDCGATRIDSWVTTTDWGEPAYDNHVDTSKVGHLERRLESLINRLTALDECVLSLQAQRNDQVLLDAQLASRIDKFHDVLLEVIRDIEPVRHRWGHWQEAIERLASQVGGLQTAQTDLYHLINRASTSNLEESFEHCGEIHYSVRNLAELPCRKPKGHVGPHDA